MTPPDGEDRYRSAADKAGDEFLEKIGWMMLGLWVFVAVVGTVEWFTAGTANAWVGGGLACLAITGAWVSAVVLTGEPRP